jgi:hypothetical protein
MLLATIAFAKNDAIWFRCSLRFSIIVAVSIMLL